MAVLPFTEYECCLKQQLLIKVIMVVCYVLAAPFYTSFKKTHSCHQKTKVLIIFLLFYFSLTDEPCHDLHTSGPLYISISHVFHYLWVPSLLYTIPRVFPLYHSIKYEGDSVSLKGKGVMMGCPKVLVCDAGASGLQPSLTKEAPGQSQRGFSVYIYNCVLCVWMTRYFCLAGTLANLSDL